MNRAAMLSLVRVVVIALALGSAIGPVSTARAQSSQKIEEIRPPAPGKEDDTHSYVLNMLIAIALMGIVVGAAVIPSKRGHQD
ncbi:MAG: hypothetical protein AB7Q00_03410 [Phycisphaerales bacterium]|nr:MAG: hypothetical protein IPK69_08035 [Phycisphaerales bacterium]